MGKSFNMSKEDNTLFLTVTLILVESSGVTRCK